VLAQPRFDPQYMFIVYVSICTALAQESSTICAQTLRTHDAHLPVFGAACASRLGHPPRDTVIPRLGTALAKQPSVVRICQP